MDTTGQTHEAHQMWGKEQMEELERRQRCNNCPLHVQSCPVRTFTVGSVSLEQQKVCPSQQYSFQERLH